jgi:proteasome assembly chaperone (PAC2) family protein
MADELRIDERPQLERPVLIAAFRGWNDGGQGASLAGAYLAQAWAAEEFASIDSEGFYDFQATRPQVSLVDGITRQLDWPENAFFHAPIPGADRDAIVLLGVEPNLRWKTFTNLVLELSQELGVEMLVTLGSLLADVPHTRPAPVTGAATDPALVAELGLEPSRYEGPTGIVGVVHDACRDADIPSVSLWAAVPHYVSLAPSPRAALALVRRLGDLLRIDIELDELEHASEEYSEQVSEAVSTDAETASYVEELERRVDMLEAAEDLPSGESLAAELTRYLREREENDDDGSDAADGPAV